MENELTLIVSSAFGVEAITKRELKNLGFDNLTATSGNIELKCTLADIARLNINLRTADRIYLQLGEFTAETFDELYENISRINLTDYIEKDAKLLITAKAVKSRLYAISAIQSITKKALIENLKKSYKTRQITESGNIYRIEIQLLNDKAKILLNTSGLPLHKRGYRELTVEAPLKETLAAAIILNSFGNPERILVDPFCGSGTIPVEAAMIALRIAPGLKRDFDFLHWAFYDKKFYFNEIEKAASIIDFHKDKKIFASDINRDVLKIADVCAYKAGVSKAIDFKCKDAIELSSNYSNGIIITNPPYGERLLDETEVNKLYKTFYSSFRKLDNWNLYFLSSNKNTEKAFGRKADKKRKFFNGNLECNLYQYYSPPPQI